MTKFYAVVQAGTTSFGAGKSVEEARTEAKEWLDQPEMEEMPLAKWDAEWNDAVMHGNVVVVECSEAFFNAINEDPTVFQNWDYDDMMLKTNDEVE